MTGRIEKLEDPISCLHEDVPTVAKLIYDNLQNNDSDSLIFPDEFYMAYSRPLAALNSSGLISKTTVLGSKVPISIELIDASFIMYMCNLAEDSRKMYEIVDTMERCEVGIQLDGEDLKHSIGLPICVIRAVFEIYEKKGYGFLSKTIGTCSYTSTA